MNEPKKSVLAIDSSESFLHFLEIILHRLGYSLHKAYSGEEGLDLLQRHRVNLVISEVRFHDMDGFSLCRSLRTCPETSGLPVIIITSDGSPRIREEALRCGCKECLTKPLNVRHLYLAIEDHMEKRRRRYIRLPMTLTVEVNDRLGSLLFQTQSFGEGGMFLKLPDPPPVGQVLSLSIHLPGHDTPLHLMGKVVHSASHSSRTTSAGAGVSFVDPSPETGHLLSAFMERKLIEPMVKESAGGLPRASVPALGMA